MAAVPSSEDTQSVGRAWRGLGTGTWLTRVVVNPAARTDKSSPIYGMPILNADKARQVYAIKRGQGKGYSGIENELFYANNCAMVYGDAQAVLTQMVQAVKEVAPLKAAA